MSMYSDALFWACYERSCMFEILVWLCVLTQPRQLLVRLAAGSSIQKPIPVCASAYADTNSNTCLCLPFPSIFVTQVHTWMFETLDYSQKITGELCACLCCVSVQECAVGLYACTHMLVLCVCVHFICRGTCSFGDKQIEESTFWCCPLWCLH